jgi:hypothetical protein
VKTANVVRVVAMGSNAASEVSGPFDGAIFRSHGPQRRTNGNGEANKLILQDRAAHDFAGLGSLAHLFS